MARDGSGNYTLPNDALVTGETSDVTEYNSTMDDIASALSGSLAANGETVITGTIDLNANKLVVDLDGDTSITADTDDQIDIEIGGSDVVVITADAMTLTGTFEPSGDVSAGDNAAFGYHPSLGAILTGQGTVNDVTLVNDADATVLSVLTGTTNVDVVGDLTAQTFHLRS